MWIIHSAPTDDRLFEHLTPERVLYEFDGPQLYVAMEGGRPLLVYVADSDDDELLRRLIVVPTSPSIVRSLSEGRYSVCDALRQPWLHIVDQTYDGVIENIWYFEDGLESVPHDYKPAEGTLLSVELEKARVEDESALAKKINQSATVKKAELRRAVVGHGTSTQPTRMYIQLCEGSIAAWENSSIIRRVAEYHSHSTSLKSNLGEAGLVDPMQVISTETIRLSHEADDYRRVRATIRRPANLRDFKFSARNPNDKRH